VLEFQCGWFGVVSVLQAELQIEVQTENLCTSVKLFHCHLVVDKVALGQVFLRLSYATIILPVLRTHLHKRVAITRTNGTMPVYFPKKQCSFGSREALDKKLLSLFQS